MKAVQLFGVWENLQGRVKHEEMNGEWANLYTRNIKHKAYIRNCFYFVAADVNSQLTSLQQISHIFLQIYILITHNFNMSQLPHSVTQYWIWSTYKGLSSQFWGLLPLIDCIFSFWAVMMEKIHNGGMK